MKVKVIKLYRQDKSDAEVFSEILISIMSILKGNRIAINQLNSFESMERERKKAKEMTAL